VQDALHSDSAEIIELNFEPLGMDFGGNGTPILAALFQTLSDSLCDDCIKLAIDTLDLSWISR
jgi:hypothetical protein